MTKNFKKRYIIGIAAILLVSLLLGVGALVLYTSNVTLTPTKQLTLGYSSTAAWTFYVNEVNQIKYMPGANASGIVQPTFNAGDTSTYAFNVVTDSNKVCAVQIDLLAAMDTTKFSMFDVTVLSNDSGTWTPVTLYAASTGSTTTPALDGISNTAVYIHQDISTNSYYLVQVNYSYDKVDTTATISPAFQYTPLPQNNFT